MKLKKPIAIQASNPPLITQRAFDSIQIKITIIKADHSAPRDFNAAPFPATLKQLYTEIA